MRIGITGATSLIGQELCDFAIAKGHEVVRLIRLPSEQSDRYFAINDEVPRCDLSDLDAVVHLAWARPKDSGELDTSNVVATEYLAAQCVVQRIRFVFVSSTTVFNAGSSRYGSAKLRAEEVTCRYNGVVVRPGLVWGGELMKSPILQQLARIAAIPLVLPTLSPDPLLYHSEITVLCQTLVRVCDEPSLSGSRVCAFAHDQIALSAILKAMRTRGLLMTFRLPTGLCISILRFLDRFRIRIGIEAESLRFALPSKSSLDLQRGLQRSSEFSQMRADNFVEWLIRNG